MKGTLVALILATLIFFPADGATQVGLVSRVEVGPDLSARYAWLSDERPHLTRLEDAFPAPDGYQRVDVTAGSFGAWLRHLPVRLDRDHVLARTGRRLASPSAAVIYLDVLKYQQCADSAIRLHAEWLWSSGRRDEIAYHFTSGDESKWKAWSRGERFRVSGSSVKRVQTGRTVEGRAALEDYFEHLFTYAGTRSLRFDSEPVDPADVLPGDFFVAPGSPGHAVMILDIALGPDGKRRALIGQGFMPTQEFHVVEDRRRALGGVWFELPSTADARLETPSWKAFSGAQLRRFKVDGPT